MKKIYVLLLLQLMWGGGGVNAQEVDASACLRNYFCSLSLCDTCPVPFPNFAKDRNINYGKYLTTTNNYPGDITYANENSIGQPCMSGSTSCTTDSTGILRYDVYYPTGHNYNACPLPVVVFVHGGGFSDCNPMDTASVTGEEFAKRGFVFFNVEYRTGRRLSPNPGAYPFFTVQQQLAVYRASQDARGAIRSIIKRQREQFALPVGQRGPYQIDTNYIFLAGASAGSITVLNVAYYPRQSMMDSINNYAGPVSISQALGLIDADYYYGGVDIEYSSKIKGVLNQWGSVSLPYGFDSTTAKNFFDKRVPVISFHGQLDPVVNIYQSRINFAPVDPIFYGNTYNRETSCTITGSFKTNGDTTLQPDFTAYGSISFFYNILQPLNIPSELHVDCQMRHGLDAAGAGFQSNFGTPYTSPDSVTRYNVSRGAVFFQNIIGNNAQPRQDTASTHKVFVECRNYRIKCNLTNNDAGCNNAHNCSNIQ